MTKRTPKSANPRDSRTVYLRIDNATIAAITAEAERESRSLSSQIAHVLKQFVREHVTANG